MTMSLLNTDKDPFHPYIKQESYREGQNFNRGVLEFIPRVLLISTAEKEPVKQMAIDICEHLMTNTALCLVSG